MPRQIHILFNLLALFVIIYIVVHTFYRVVGIQLHRVGGEKVIVSKDIETHAAKSLIRPEYSMIVERNIFGATEKSALPPAVEEKSETLETLEETTLQLTLLGTVAGDQESGRAFILDNKVRSQNIYRVGDTVQDAEIRQILRGKVVLRHGEKDEILTLVEADEKQPPTAAAARNARRVSRGRRAPSRPKVEEPPEDSAAEAEPEEEIISVAQDELQGSINDLNQLMTQVRIRPYFRQGKPEGLIVSQIQADSIFEKLGLMNGDIIASVNGNQMTSPEEAFQLYNSLNSGSQVSIEITRRGQKKMFTYDIQ